MINVSREQVASRQREVSAKRRQLIDEIAYILDQRAVGELMIRFQFLDGYNYEFKAGAPIFYESVNKPKIGLIAKLLNWRP